MSTFHQVWLIIAIALRFTCAKRYDLPQGWEVKNSRELPGYTNHRLLQVGNTSMVSGNGRFGLSFFRFNQSSEFYLALLLGTGNYSSNSSASSTCVWSANRDAPLGENSTVRLSNQGELQLLDSAGAPVWRSPPGVSTLEVRDDGNVLLYNSKGGILWESFRHPTDVLLPGQTLVTGESLLSSYNSTSLSSGKMKLEVRASGLAFFVISGQDSQPYFVRVQWNGNLPSDLQSVSTPCPTYRAVLGYSSDQVTLNYQATENSTSSRVCGPPIVLGNLGNSSSSGLQYLKLGSDGGLVSYVYEPGTLAWEGQTVLTNVLGDCLPLACQSNSVCLRNTSFNCRCIAEEGSDTRNEVCPSPSSIPLVCNHEVEAENHHFFNVSGAGYFSNNYTKADRVSPFEECRDACLGNCSCKALFYNKQTQSCFFVDRMYGGLTEDPNFDAFLKLQNLEPFVRRSRRSPHLLIGLCIGAGVLFLAMLGLIGLRIWKTKLENDAKTLALALQGSARKFSYKELEIATGNFSSRLGSGGYGTVYEGMIEENGAKVAVKRLEGGNLRQENGFIAEVTSLGRISHQNVVQLYGFCSDNKQRMLVYEYMVNGSLDKWLFNPDQCLEWGTRQEIALGIARGLAYLHEEARQLIVHLDIKPENVLLNDKFQPKLCDFGLAKLLDNRDVSHVITIRGTPGYLAPEWLLYSTATKKCDVYSYGVVLLEIIGGRRSMLKLDVDNRNSAEGGDESLWWYFPAWVAAQVEKGEFVGVVDARIRDGVQHIEAKRLIQVALWCLQEDPTLRPSMDAVVQMLLGRAEIEEPPLYFRFAVRSSGALRFASTASGGVSVIVSDLHSRF